MRRAARIGLVVTVGLIALAGMVNVMLGGVPMHEARRWFAARTYQPPAKPVRPPQIMEATIDMADSVYSPWCKTDETVGACWGFKLKVQNLDEVHDQAPYLDATGVSASASTVGCSASMAFAKAANGNQSRPVPTFGWSAAEEAAWQEWTDGGDPAGEYVGFLYAATVTAGTNSDAQYKVFGYIVTEPGIAGGWHGDTEWELPGTFGVTGVRVRTRTGSLQDG